MVEGDAGWKLRGKCCVHKRWQSSHFALRSIALRKTSKCSQSQLQIYSKLLKTRCHSIRQMLSLGVVLAQVCDFSQKKLFSFDVTRATQVLTETSCQSNNLHNLAGCCSCSFLQNNFRKRKLCFILAIIFSLHLKYCIDSNCLF